MRERACARNVACVRYVCGMCLVCVCARAVCGRRGRLGGEQGRLHGGRELDEEG